MIVAVTGGRRFDDFALVERTFQTLPSVDLIIHGGCSGADNLCDKYAWLKGIHTAVIRALWSTYGKPAGPIRNRVMMSFKPDLLIAFPGGKGTESCIQEAEKLNIRVVRAV